MIGEFPKKKWNNEILRKASLKYIFGLSALAIKIDSSG